MPGHIRNAADNVAWTAAEFRDVADQVQAVLSAGKLTGKVFLTVKEGPTPTNLVEVLDALQANRLAVAFEIDLPQPAKEGQ